MPPVPVLHLITELSTGGAQFALLRLLSQTDRERFSPQVACLYNGQANVAQKIRALGIPVTDLNMTARWRADAFWRLYRLLRRSQPLILHTWLFHANLPGRIVGRLAGVPVIISSERTMEMEGSLRRRLNRLTAPLADRIVCVSETVAAFARREIGLPPHKLVVIPNGIDTGAYDHLPTRQEARQILGLPEDGIFVGSIGRLQPVKGQAVLLEAFAQLSAQHPDTRLVLAGDGPDLPALQAQAERLGLAERVIFLGHREDVPVVLAALDLLALPSFHEGMPNAVLEAMAAGLPVAATSAGGTPELVIPGETGLLAAPGDAAGLADALDTLLADPGLREALGRAGRERARSRYSLDETVRKTEQLYTDLLALKVPAAQKDKSYPL